MIGGFDRVDYQLIPLQRGFPALRCLKLPWIPNSFIVLSIFASITSVTLTSLSLSFPETSIPATLRCLEKLFSLSALRRLQHFKLNIYLELRLPDASQPPVNLVFKDMLQLLRPLVHLRSISLNIDGSPLDVRADDMTLVAATWPSLVRLSLEYGPLWWKEDRTRPDKRGLRPPLTSLISLAESCPNLERVIVDFADVTHDELDRLESRLAEAGSFPHATLVHLAPTTALDSRRVVVDDVDRLIRMLRMAFPRLRGTSLEDLTSCMCTGE